MKKSWCVMVLVLAMVTTLTACTPTSPPVTGDEPETPKVLHASDWKDTYPEIYESFKLGGNVIKDDGSNRSHSHAVHMKNCGDKVELVYSDMDVYFNTVAMRCLLCKTEDTLAIYEKYGDDALQMSYAEVLPMVEDFWGCYCCHENDPENTVVASLQYWQELYKGSAVKISDEDATCGQCHNIFHCYKGIEDLTMEKLATYAPYKYGLSADQMRKAVLEVGMNEVETDLYVSIDEPTGLVTWRLHHPDVEIFQTSNHKALGMSCHSCHMPEVTSPSGVTYTSHDASGSPLKNEAALQSCLQCHSHKNVVSEPVSTTEEMVAYVNGIQAEVGAMETQIQSDMQVLRDLVLEAIENGATDEDLALARENYTTAGYYFWFCRGNATEPGLKSPHNAEEMRILLTRAQELLDDAIASL